jgi:hypothetical protein
MISHRVTGITSCEWYHIVWLASHRVNGITLCKWCNIDIVWLYVCCLEMNQMFIVGVLVGNRKLSECLRRNKHILFYYAVLHPHHCLLLLLTHSLSPHCARAAGFLLAQLCSVFQSQRKIGSGQQVGTWVGTGWALGGN